MTDFIISISIIVFITFVFVLVEFLKQKRKWNNGICGINGKPWKLFSIGETGTKGYEAGGEILWVSYPFVDN